MNPVRHTPPTHPPRPGPRPLTVLLLALLTLALFATACGGSDSDTADSDDAAAVEELDACRLSDELEDEVALAVAHALCAADGDAVVSDDNPDGLRFVRCPDSDAVELQIDGQRAYWRHMGVRFHPADARTPWVGGDPAWKPSLTGSSVDPPKMVYVVDELEHGTHAKRIIEGMLVGLSYDVELIELPRTAQLGDVVLFAASEIREVLTNELGDEEISKDVVINMSFGAYACEADPGKDLLLAWILGLPDNVTVVASAGNDESDVPVIPAALDRVRAVGSLADDGTRSCFSNHGGWVTDWAVGEEVYSSDENGGEEVTWSGTSFAAPQVAAALAAGVTADGAVTATPAPLANPVQVELLDGGQSIPSSAGGPVMIETYCAIDSDYRYRNVRYQGE